MHAEGDDVKADGKENQWKLSYLVIRVIVPTVVKQYNELCFVLVASQVQVPQ